MTDTQRNKRPARRPDCVTETRIGNTIPVSYTHLTLPTT